MRIGVFVTHPIQYFAPIWQRLAATPGIDLVVHFFSDHSVSGRLDSGFGVPVAWDVPLLEGYHHRFITRDADLSRPLRVRMDNARQVLADGRFDVVIFHGYTYGFERQLVRAAAIMGVKTLMRGEFTDAEPDVGRSHVKGWLRDQYLRRFYRRIDAFCYIGQGARDHLQRLGVPAERMFFSPYSVDTAQFDSQRQRFDRASARQDLSLSPDTVALLFSGKLIPRKAPLLLLEAIRKLPDAALVSVIIVGDGELRRQVESDGRELLGPRLVFPGFVNQSELGRYFSAADAFVLPSIFETWGLVVNEAMQFGLPVVVSDRVGCHRDLVVEGQTGFTFPSGNAQALATAIGRLVSSTPDRIRMGVTARQHIARYSTEQSVEGILQAIAHVQPRRP